MLKKLFVYDFNAIRRRALPFLLAALGCGVLSFFVTLVDFVLPEDGDIALFLGNTLTALLVGLLIAFFVLLVLSEFHIFSHFYRNLFTDEGYFTFMLPATREQIILGKILAGAAFSLLILLVALLSGFIGILLPVEILMRAENASFLTVLLRDLGDLFTVWGVLSFVISLLSQIVFIYTAISLGALFFRKRKVLGAFVFYFVLSGVMSFVQAFFALLFFSITETGEPFISIFSILSYLLVGFGGYLIMKTLFTRKLNLI